MFIPSEYSAPKNLLLNKVILITGGGSGIGKTAACTFARYGAEIVLIGKNKDNLEKTYELLIQENLEAPMLQVLDLAKAEEKNFIQVSRAILEEYGRLDGLLNNASILGDKSPVESYDTNKWKQVLRVNLESSFLLTKSLIPVLKKAKEASVVFTSSGVGRKGRAYWGAYAVSKFATEGLMQILSEELEKTSKIRVNAINPGPVRTTMRAKAYPAENPQNNPEPKDIMNAYLFLLGKDSLGFTGKSIDAQ